MKLDTTPWARAVMDDVLEASIRKAAPKDALMHVGRGTVYWRAVVTWQGRVLADSRREQMTDAVLEALDAV